MNKYIDAEKLKRWIKAEANPYGAPTLDYDTALKIMNMIDKMSIETIQTHTGKWILTSDGEYEYCTCSECGYQNGENWMIGSEIPYCEKCGAKMTIDQMEE